MQRDRDVNNRETPGTVLPRAHPNAGTDGDAAENGPLTSRVSRRSGTQPTAPAAKFIYEIETYGRRQSGDPNSTRSRESNYALRRGMPIALPFAL